MATVRLFDMTEKVQMYFPPTGETREVEARPDAILPLQVKGWHQYRPENNEKPEAPATTENK